MIVDKLAQLLLGRVELAINKFLTSICDVKNIEELTKKV